VVFDAVALRLGVRGTENYHAIEQIVNRSLVLAKVDLLQWIAQESMRSEEQAVRFRNLEPQGGCQERRRRKEHM